VRDRILFPKTGFTKVQAIDYYRRVAKYLLPHIRKRPMSFKRYPDTVTGESFWEKDAPSFTPEWVPRVPVRRRGGESDIEYIVVNNVRTLTWIVQAGGIELHPFLHRVPKLDHPTDLVFDLDPGEGATLAHCCRVARILRTALRGARLESFVKVSGSKGMQVYVPLNTPTTHDATLTFAQLVADEIARAHPKLVTAKMTKSLRVRKVFIDWSQNADYKTTVAVYSLRAKRDQPYVSMPVRWEELDDPSKLEFEPDQALKRVARFGDIWADKLTMRQSLAVSEPLAEKKTPANGSRLTANGIRLPKPGSQSGRRLFVLPRITAVKSPPHGAAASLSKTSAPTS
jgi:bifunctional non-homologous end joining protein LigD